MAIRDFAGTQRAYFMAQVDCHGLLRGKDEQARFEIARRVGARLCGEDLSEADRAAAEALARSLVDDAIETVRAELSKAVKNARHLARDVALKIAHDVDSVSCPFLQATDIFSEHDWQQLILTISRGGRVAVACRNSISEGIATSLAQIGDAVVAQALVENKAAPMTPRVCDPLIDRFEGSTWILDKLADREDLIAETASKLISKVSNAARDKLSSQYRLGESAASITSVAEIASTLRLIRSVPNNRLVSLVQHLKHQGKLTYALLISALRDGSMGFFVVSISVLTGARMPKVEDVMRFGAEQPVKEMLLKAGVPATLLSQAWELLQSARVKMNGPSH